MIPDCDISLIAGRREALLARTLASFSERVFRHFTVRQMIVNIDPFMGDAAEGDRCEALVRGYFPHALIFRPEEPDFASAVARAWAATTAPRVLHLEDDWIALEDITPERVEPLLVDDAKAVTFMTATKHTRGLLHQVSRRIVKGPEGEATDLLVNAFSTSPGVFEGAFLRQAATLMRPRLDPEKQFFRQINPELEAHALPWRCMFLRGVKSRMLIEDIGRAMRDEQGIVKSYENGMSLWRKAKEAAGE